ncbi:MAG: ribulose-phosphate 3-epimerase [Rikenellaceae bacterium]|nr:ribulose-phosphate 3-epimerase [Rikenellaceae bacterium]
MKKRIVAPSVLSADFGHLERDVRMVAHSRAEWIHLDVMDGVFVPNISFGFPVLKAVVAAAQGKTIDTHLMTVEPERYLKRFAEAGSNCITFHVEATHNPQKCIDIIHEAGARAGICIKPATPVEAIAPWLPQIDLVLIMSVEPGFGGQTFMPVGLDKARQLDRLRRERGYKYFIEMDGGIGAHNAAVVYGAGCEAIVAGNAVFGAEDPEMEIVKILEAQ